jgi:hypothetical protein
MSEDSQKEYIGAARTGHGVVYCLRESAARAKTAQLSQIWLMSFQLLVA